MSSAAGQTASRNGEPCVSAPLRPPPQVGRHEWLDIKVVQIYPRSLEFVLEEREVEMGLEELEMI